MATASDQLFNDIRDRLLNLDPVLWAENHLNLDGKAFSLHGNGYKPFTDIYRYIGIKALEKNSLPVVLVKGRQVGMTTAAAILSLYFMANGLSGNGERPPIRVMHGFPQLEFSYTYSKTKLAPIINGAKFLDSELPKKPNAKKKNCIENKLDSTTASSLQFKQFEGGNFLCIDSIGIDANRMRSRTCDVFFFDEVQDMRGVAISNATKILSKAQYGRPGDGVQVYFGTPKQQGSEYWKIWQSSSQQYYHLGCEQCKQHFPLYTPGSNEWENIWIEDFLPDTHPSHGFIVKCTHCGHEQDKKDAAERGKWIPLNKSDDIKFIGYHINQLYIPDLPRSKIIGEKPENHHSNTERTYQNEVLGEFYSGDASPMTSDQIDELCADQKRKFAIRLLPSDSRKVYLGCDWGDKVDADQLVKGDGEKKQRGQSYSCVVVLSTDGPHILSIEYACRLKKNDFEYKKSFMEGVFRRYSVNLAVGDIGHAGELSEVLHREYGDRFLTSRASGYMNNHVKYHPDLFPKEIRFDKDYYISELYNIMKEGKVRFPYGDYEQLGWLIQHCCSMELKPTVDRSGEVDVKYVKGNTPNDGFMALLNAYLAYKFDITQGFSIHNPHLMRKDPAKAGQVRALAAYLPGLNPSRRR